MKRCPYCAEEIQEAAIICRFCQRGLPVPAQRLRGLPVLRIVIIAGVVGVGIVVAVLAGLFWLLAGEPIGRPSGTRSSLRITTTVTLRGVNVSNDSPTDPVGLCRVALPGGYQGSYEFALKAAGDELVTWAAFRGLNAEQARARAIRGPIEVSCRGGDGQSHEFAPVSR